MTMYPAPYCLLLFIHRPCAALFPVPSISYCGFLFRPRIVLFSFVGIFAIFFCRQDVDVNMRAIFIHFLGDCISSFCVLLTGLLIEKGTGRWVLYVDPASSLVIVIVIVVTTIPLVPS